MTGPRISAGQAVPPPAPALADSAARPPRPGDFALIGRQVVEILGCDDPFVSVRFPGDDTPVVLLRDALLYPVTLRQN